ncbi:MULTISPECIES: YdcF family protein [Bacillus]|uniref:YdcF family protein n=1 Tax=Bacillus TaxID=1386 RepID=UPI0020A092DF|nr:MULTISPECIES: YdcF family protein [Bacillus]MCP1158931.1 YdcF family protein [Bacillus infantis]MDT0162549.1 YdcF family protein [Bacillus sp. AG4(2022)]
MKTLISKLDFNQLSDRQIGDLLYKNIADDKKSGECIFVLGSSKAAEYRLPKALELYNSGRAGKLLFSGGVIWAPSRLCEADLLKEKALALGIPAADILIENQSLHTKENVLASLLVLDREFNLHKIKRILVVTASCHIRRAYLAMKTYMPDWIEYSLCPVDDIHTIEGNWQLSEAGRLRAKREAEKLIYYVKQGIIIDTEVEISDS